jgi:hypothetical protein
MARAAIELGFYISISGIVTFQQAQNVRDMARQVPLERLLIETDSPWLSPAPFRGKPNHPGRVRLVAEKLAEIRGESIDTIASATVANANKNPLPNSRLAFSPNKPRPCRNRSRIQPGRHCANYANSWIRGFSGSRV